MSREGKNGDFCPGCFRRFGKWEKQKEVGGFKFHESFECMINFIRQEIVALIEELRNCDPPVLENLKKSVMKSDPSTFKSVLTSVKEYCFTPKYKVRVEQLSLILNVIIEEYQSKRSQSKRSVFQYFQQL